MTMEGWGTHFDRTETWWEQSKAWHDYIARCQYLLQSGLFAADVCYLDVEDAPRDAPYPIKLPGYDYDVCPAEVVKTRMRVSNGRITLPDITFTNAGKDDGFRWIHRRTDTADFYFIANQLAEEKQVTCTFRVAGAQPKLWHPETGTISALPVCQATADGRSEVPLKFDPHEAFFVVFRKGGQKVTVDGVQKPERNWREFIPAQKIDGAWNVTFEPKWGGPEKPIVFETLADWSRHATDGIRFYSGAAVYQKTFDVEPSVAGLPSVFLDLGQVEVMADVKLNGKDLGTLWKKPFRIDVTGDLKPGANDVEIRVVNLWCNRLIGDQQLPEDAEWKDGFMGWGGKFQILKSWPQWLKDGKPSPAGRFTFSTASYYNKEDALLPSGLLGPVQLMKSDSMR